MVEEVVPLKRQVVDYRTAFSFLISDLLKVTNLPFVRRRQSTVLELAQSLHSLDVRTPPFLEGLEEIAPYVLHRVVGSAEVELEELFDAYPHLPVVKASEQVRALLDQLQSLNRLGHQA